MERIYVVRGMLCGAEGCKRPPHGHGLCNNHLRYLRRRGAIDVRRGSPLEVMRIPRQKRARAEDFWSHVLKSETCWLWTAGVSGVGYGQFTVFNRHRQAHRVAYELVIGPIPMGLELDHLCVNRLCVNPAHLEPVSKTENIRRAAEFKQTRVTRLDRFGPRALPEAQVA